MSDHLDQVIHDALIDHTSDHEWVDTVGPHIEAAVAKWLHRQPPRPAVVLPAEMRNDLTKDD